MLAELIQRSLLPRRVKPAIMLWVRRAFVFLAHGGETPLCLEQSLLPHSRLLAPGRFTDMQCLERGEFNSVKTQRFGTIRQIRLQIR